MAVLSLGTAKASELKNLKRNADGTYYYDYLLDEDEREINTGNAAADNWLSTRRSSVKRDDAPEDAKKRIEIWSDVVKEQKQQSEKLEKKAKEKPKTNENGRIGDRPYARGRTFSEDHYKD